MQKKPPVKAGGFLFQLTARTALSAIIVSIAPSL
jgi:hypothetical protein